MGALLSLGLFAAGMVLLVVGGELLVRGAVALAERLGVSPLTIGLTIVAFGTSAPELALNLVAAARGDTGLTFGNMVGSSLANVGWVLGLVACLRPVKVGAALLRRELPLLLGGVLLVLGLSWLPPHVGQGAAGLTRLEGALLLAAFLCVQLLLLRAAARPRLVGPQLGQELVEVATREPLPLRSTSVAQALGGLALLGFGGALGEKGAVGLAAQLGLSQQLVGLTVVSLATTLPELVTSVVAARRGQGDLALGNVVGSNLFNLLFVLGAVALLTGLPLPPGAGVSLLALLAITLLLFPLCLSYDWTLTRREGLLLVAFYLGFLGYQLWQALRVAL